MSLERKTLNLTVKSLEENGTFEGLLSVYDVIDEYGDVVERGAYTKTLQENGGRLPMLWQHNQELPIGVLEVSDGADGLEVKGSLLLDDDVPQAKTAYALLKAGIIRGLSIGFRTIRKKSEEKIRRLKEIKLYEGSLVTIPANRFALVSDVKSFKADVKDFAAELEMIQLIDSHYQLMSALRAAIHGVVHDKKLTADEKVEAAGDTIDQFRSSFMAFLPKYLAMMEEMDGMYYMSADQLIEKFSTAPDELRERLTQFSTTFLATVKHPDTSQDAVRAAEPIEEKTIDQEALQSWFKDAGERLRLALLA